MPIETQHTMPIHGCVPNQLQALHDELGAAQRTIAELRGLLALAELDGLTGSCQCDMCGLKREIKAVLER